MAVATYTVADAKTDPVAVAFKWRTLLPTDVAAATLADLGGALQSGTGSIAANASPRQAQFSVTTTPNTTVDGDRSFDVEIYDVTPAVATLTVSKVRTKIVEDEVASGPVVVYGPASTTDTTVHVTGSRLHKVKSVFRNDRLYTLRIAVSGSSYIEMRSDSGTAVNFRLIVDGAQVGNAINMSSVTNGAPADGSEVSFERKMLDGAYIGYATFGYATYTVFIGGDLTGTSAQGLIWYGSAENYTITAA